MIDIPSLQGSSAIGFFILLSGCSQPLPHYPKIVEADGYLVECGKPYTNAEDRAGVEHDCTYYGRRDREDRR